MCWSRICTDAGIEGAGEATVLPRWSGETVWGAHALIDRVLAPHLVGRDPTDLAGIAALMDQAAEDNWFAKSALEMACWDIRGKEAGRPVYELLGDWYARGPFAAASRWARTSRSARRCAASSSRRALTRSRSKSARTSPPTLSAAAVRETIGPEPAIVIDANCGYDARPPLPWPTRSRIAACRSSSSPHLRGDFQALADVRQAIGPEVMADDICFDLADAVECIRHAACDVISVYPGKNGGIAKSKAIIDYAAAHGVATSIGSNLELDIARSAMSPSGRWSFRTCRSKNTPETSWAPTTTRCRSSKIP